MLHRSRALHTIPAIQYSHGNVCMNVLQLTDCDDAHNDNDDDVDVTIKEQQCKGCMESEKSIIVVQLRIAFTYKEEYEQLREGNIVRRICHYYTVLSF